MTVLDLGSCPIGCSESLVEAIKTNWSLVHITRQLNTLAGAVLAR